MKPGTADGGVRGVMICLQEETECESEDGSTASESDGMTTKHGGEIRFERLLICRKWLPPLSCHRLQKPQTIWTNHH